MVLNKDNNKSLLTLKNVNHCVAMQSSVMPDLSIELERHTIEDCLTVLSRDCVMTLCSGNRKVWQIWVLCATATFQWIQWIGLWSFKFLLEHFVKWIITQELRQSGKTISRLFNRFVRWLCHDTLFWEQKSLANFEFLVPLPYFNGFNGLDNGVSRF